MLTSSRKALPTILATGQWDLLLFQNLGHGIQKFADDRIRTVDLSCSKQLLYKLTHSHCPRFDTLEVDNEIKKHSQSEEQLFYIPKFDYLQLMKKIGFFFSCSRWQTALTSSGVFQLLMRVTNCFFKWAILSIFFTYFHLFKQKITIPHQINVKNVHPVCSAGIQTHNLWNTSLLT